MFGTREEFDARRFAPATARNRDPILEVLRRVLPAQGTILEVASGTGEHAAFFAPRLAPLVWQPSECDRSLRASIRAHCEDADAAILREPLDLDVTARPWPISSAAAVVAINLLHIAPWPVCEALFGGAAALLPSDAPLYLYGPFVVQGDTAASNRRFDRELRARDPAWGLRELEEVTAAAMAAGFRLDEIVRMPANNLSVIFRKLAAG